MRKTILRVRKTRKQEEKRKLYSYYIRSKIGRQQIRDVKRQIKRKAQQGNILTRYFKIEDMEVSDIHHLITYLEKQEFDVTPNNDYLMIKWY